MNLITLSLPKTLLVKYIENHITEITVNDFFQIAKKINFPINSIKRSEILRKSPEVLSYLLDKNINYFVHFDEEAFSEECIDKIANHSEDLLYSQIVKYPFLLNNDKICESFIRKYPFYFKMIPESKVNNKMIILLEELSYTPDEEDIDKYPIFLKNEQLMKNAIKRNPLLFLRLDKPSNTLVHYALLYGYVPEKQHLIDNPYLLTKKDLVERLFKTDPSIIAYFDDYELTNDVVSSARRRGYIATEEDLIRNIHLRNLSEIMSDAIKNNPRLLIYLTQKTYVEKNIIVNALKQYKITVEDLENNPELAANKYLMDNLPEFSLYSLYLDDKEKEKHIASVLRESKELTTRDLPFLSYKFGSKVNIKKLRELLSILNYYTNNKDLNIQNGLIQLFNINENDLKTQQKYYQILDKIIDGIVNTRYLQNKAKFKYHDIVSLNNSITNLFSENDPDKISDYAYELYIFIGKTIPLENIKSELDNLYNIYLKNKTIDLNITNNFCNNILNQHRNYYLSKEKSTILKELAIKMNLNKNKINSIIRGKKLQIVTNFIKNKYFTELGITREQLLADIENVQNSLLKDKNLKKAGIELNSTIFDIFKTSFLYHGTLDERIVRKHLKTDNINAINNIIKKYESIKFKYLDKLDYFKNGIHISDNEKEKLGGLNHANYLIADNEKCIENIAKLLVKLDDETIDNILNNKNILNEITFLIPFLNYTDELDIDTFINILSCYDKIRYKFLSKVNKNEIDFNEVLLNKIDDMILLANAYSSMDDLSVYALGNDVLETIGEHNSSKYLDFYLQIIGKQSGNIPPVSFKYKDYTFESGNYSDPNRLLIGKVPTVFSCIDLLNFAGVETYKEVLSKDSGDVVLIKDKNNQPVSRIFIFRRGNIIQLIANQGSTFSYEIYKEIADQILKQSIENNDNIEYVFLNSASAYHESFSESNTKIKDTRFEYKFPHADTNQSAFLLNSKNNILGFKEEKIKMDFNIKPKARYQKNRKQVSYYPTDEEINRLRALRIITESDPIIKDELSRSFELFYVKDYKKVVCGEDWYIAIRLDGSIEEVILPTGNERTISEMQKVKDEILSNEETLSFDIQESKL